MAALANNNIELQPLQVDDTDANAGIDEISIVTFNAGLLSYGLCGLRLYENPPFSEQRVHYIASALKEVNPDILCLQEVYTERHADYIARVLKPTLPFIARCASGGKLSLHNGLMVFSKFPIVQTYFHKFSECTFIERIFASKGMLEVTVNIPHIGHVAVFNIHLASAAADPESLYMEDLRASEIRQVLGASAQAAADGRIPIVVGDLNAAPDLCASNYKLFIERGWRDCWLHVHGEQQDLLQHHLIHQQQLLDAQEIDEDSIPQHDTHTFRDMLHLASRRKQRMGYSELKFEKMQLVPTQEDIRRKVRQMSPAYYKWNEVLHPRKLFFEMKRRLIEQQQLWLGGHLGENDIDSTTAYAASASPPTSPSNASSSSRGTFLDWRLYPNESYNDHIQDSSPGGPSFILCPGGQIDGNNAINVAAAAAAAATSAAAAFGRGAEFLLPRMVNSASVLLGQQGYPSHYYRQNNRSTSCCRHPKSFCYQTSELNVPKHLQSRNTIGNCSINNIHGKRQSYEELSQPIHMKRKFSDPYNMSKVDSQHSIEDDAVHYGIEIMKTPNGVSKATMHPETHRVINYHDIINHHNNDAHDTNKQIHSNSHEGLEMNHDMLIPVEREDHKIPNRSLNTGLTHSHTMPLSDALESQSAMRYKHCPCCPKFHKGDIPEQEYCQSYCEDINPMLLNDSKYCSHSNAELCDAFTWDPSNPLNVIGPHAQCHGLRCDYVFLPPHKWAGGLYRYYAVEGDILLNDPRVFVDGGCFGCFGYPIKVTLSDHYAVRIKLRKVDRTNEAQFIDFWNKDVTPNIYTHNRGDMRYLRTNEGLQTEPTIIA